ncbi:preprotein translocase subunit SecE [Nocardioides sp. AE5]|uniref:preprotein translocase subunit SecE n=1 Tax=Nocardioides sp. AE5 TaxID=2962573 RepID=UPI002882BB85|nr:preprotein translocase subunit SecE [Nocardioides sp. AE5]MDT0200743.1 preprotein translocase subunit SecE [Nocardioides sp. AE5]
MSVSDSDAARGSSDKRERAGVLTFLKQVVAELRKVVWPTQQELVTYFIVVLVFVCAVMALVSLLDLGFGELVFRIFARNTTQ